MNLGLDVCVPKHSGGDANRGEDRTLVLWSCEVPRGPSLDFVPSTLPDNSCGIASPIMHLHIGAFKEFLDR